MIACDEPMRYITDVSKVSMPSSSARRTVSTARSKPAVANHAPPRERLVQVSPLLPKGLRGSSLMGAVCRARAVVPVNVESVSSQAAIRWRPLLTRSPLATNYRLLHRDFGASFFDPLGPKSL